jgi:hypothetical protein
MLERTGIGPRLKGGHIASLHPMKEPNTSPHFDALRIVLASVVALAHAGILTWPHAGDLAVRVFFALSGWLIDEISPRSTLDELPRFYFPAPRESVTLTVSLTLLVAVSLTKDRGTGKWFEFVFYDETFVSLVRVRLPPDGKCRWPEPEITSGASAPRNSST